MRCPSCDHTELARSARKMHRCSAFDGAKTPLLEVAAPDLRPDARHVLREREDYGEGRYMGLATLYGSGRVDFTAYAPTAYAQLGTTAIPASGCVAGARPASVGVRPYHQFRDPALAKMARIAGNVDAYMAWSASGVFAYAVLEALSAAGQNLSSDTYYVALYGDSNTPDKTVTTAALTEYNGASSQWTTTYEVSGTGYTAGGVEVTPSTIAQSSNVVTFTSSGTPQWTSATITAYGCLVYDTTKDDEGISFNYFGGASEVTDGTFSIAWNSSGIASWTS